MSSKPDFDKWAKDLINDSWTGDRIDVVSKALKESWERGYRYAVANDWWQEREKCEHQGDGIYYLTDQPQYKCDKCGVYFK